MRGFAPTGASAVKAARVAWEHRARRAGRRQAVRRIDLRGEFVLRGMDLLLAPQPQLPCFPIAVLRGRPRRALLMHGAEVGGHL
jgi:hypothetical protein